MISTAAAHMLTLFYVSSLVYRYVEHTAAAEQLQRPRTHFCDRTYAARAPSATLTLPV